MKINSPLPVELNNTQISMMVDIAHHQTFQIDKTKAYELERLLGNGLIELAPPGDDEVPVAQYKITPKGQKLLDARGVGANES